MKLFEENTPIEEYNGIYVKREDLSTLPPLPRLEKLRGANVYLKKISDQGIRNIGTFDTRISKVGWGIAGVCKYNFPELKVFCFYKKRIADDNPPTEWIKKAEELGATLMPLYTTILKHHRVSGAVSAAKQIMKEKNGWFVPEGIVCVETTLEVKRIAEKVPKKYLGGTLIVTVGSGTIMSGLICGLHDKTDIIGVSIGMNIARQKNRIQKLYTQANPEKTFIPDIKIIDTNKLYDYTYYEPEDMEVPFATAPYYDKKAWRWVMENKDKLKKPILFWNIGD